MANILTNHSSWKFKGAKMLNIWIGRNKVLRNFSMGDISELDQNSDFDCSLTGTGNHSIDVLLGKNGSGKSFVGKTLVYLAYVYYHSAPLYLSPRNAASNGNGKIHNMDVDQVVRSLDDARIGSIDDAPKEGCVSIKTSYNGKRRNNSYEERYYNVRLGPNAQSFFRRNSIVFYSNSQFPSNDFFFSEKVASFSATNVDIVFWNLKNNGSNRSAPQIALWQNKTLGLFAKNTFSSENARNFFGNQENLESALSSIKYVHRNVFLFDSTATVNWAEIEQSRIYEILRQQEESRERNPIDYINLEELTLKDYYILLLICRKFENVNFELFKGSIREKYLSSKERYDLVLDCLINMNMGAKLFIIDEPENSTHLSIQKKIAQDLPINSNVLAMTHSPEFVIGLKSQSRNVNVWSIYKENERKIVENVSKDLITESLDVTAADFFGYAPNLEKWNERNVNEDLRDVDLNALMPFRSFYDAIKSLDEVE